MRSSWLHSTLQCFYGVPELRNAVAAYALAPSGDGPAPGHRWVDTLVVPAAAIPKNAKTSMAIKNARLLNRHCHALPLAKTPWLYQ